MRCWRRFTSKPLDRREQSTPLLLAVRSGDAARGRPCSTDPRPRASRVMRSDTPAARSAPTSPKSASSQRTRCAGGDHFRARALRGLRIRRPDEIWRHAHGVLRVDGSTRSLSTVRRGTRFHDATSPTCSRTVSLMPPGFADAHAKRACRPACLPARGEMIAAREPRAALHCPTVGSHQLPGKQNVVL